MKTFTVIKMPAEGCRDWLLGRCAREERRNPGYRAEHRCAVVEGWSDRLDEFYDRAEAMRVDESALADLWQIRLEAMLPEMRRCPDFSMDDHPYSCVHLQDVLCVLAFPKCDGRCEYFTRSKCEEKHRNGPNTNHP